MRFNELKKLFVLCGSAVTATLLCSTPSLAQGDNYLQQIANNTYNTLQKVNDLPTYLQNLNTFILAWMTPDTSKPTTTMQGPFTDMGNLFVADLDAQKSLTSSLNSYMLNNDGNNVFNTNNGVATSASAATQQTLWYGNDLVYSTVLGVPLFAKDPRVKQGSTNQIDSAMNYIRNASGLNIYHKIPGSNWQGSLPAQARYQSYFNTVMAAQSFGSYVLSNQYAERDQFNTLQTTLIKQASDPTNWFAQVSSESIGFVLRQLLLYQSQIFVLLTELVQTQKQMVSAQVMTNSVLIAINQLNENMMVSNAQGTQPSATQ